MAETKKGDANEIKREVEKKQQRRGANWIEGGIELYVIEMS